MKATNIKQLFILLSILLTQITFAQEDSIIVDESIWQEPTFNYGIEADVLPYFNKGYNFSVWISYHRFKGLIDWALKYPADFVVDENYTDLRYKSTSFYLQYYPISNSLKLDKLWFGTGLSFWSNKVKYSGNGSEGTFDNLMLNASVGFLVFVTKGFYLNPYLSGHLLIFGERTPAIGGAIYHAQKFVPEISVKLGYHL